MPFSPATARLVEALPPTAFGRVALYHVGSGGAVEERLGHDDGLAFSADGEPTEAGRRECIGIELGGGSGRAVLTHDPGIDVGDAEFLRRLLEQIGAAAQVECDLESMYAGSLALLEEAAMLGEIMPLLPTGTGELEVVQMGLDALIVAASVERAAFVKYHPGANQAETIAHMRATRGGSESVEGDDGRWFDPSHGLVSRVLTGDPLGVLERVPAGGFRSAGPERFAEQEVVAVPVRYNSRLGEHALGVLMIFDKRATSYASGGRLGSQESKLAVAVASMLGAVLGTRRAAELDKELATANVIQQQILPERPASVPGFDLAGRSDTSGAVGGDYFDFLQLADGGTMVVVADVSGHNLASGMLMVSARTALRLLSRRHRRADAIFEELGRSLFDDLSRTERFITAAAAVLRARSGVIELVDAGHNDTLVFRRASGTIERVAGTATVFGFLADVPHPSRRLELAAGDVMLIHTDGITEATDGDGRMFGDERLASVFAGAAAGSAQQILTAVFDAVRAFADRGVTDDVTAVVVKFTGTGEGS